ncbi:MAG: hypothetical protein ACRCZF_08270 [Gemmataceae bacterium]
MRKVLCAAVFVTAVVFSGCSEAMSKVSGKVTANGKAVTVGTVFFFPPNNQTYSADIKPDGSYSCPTVARGKVRVSVVLPLPSVPPRPDPPAGKSKDAFGKGAAGDDDKAKRSRMPADIPAPAGVVAPPKYSNPDKSGLEFNLTAEEFTFDIDLK